MVAKLLGHLFNGLVSYVRSEFRTTLVVMYEDDIIHVVVVAHCDLAIIKLRITKLRRSWGQARDKRQGDQGYEFHVSGCLAANDLIRYYGFIIRRRTLTFERWGFFALGTFPKVSRLIAGGGYIGDLRWLSVTPAVLYFFQDNFKIDVQFW